MTVGGKSGLSDTDGRECVYLPMAHERIRPARGPRTVFEINCETIRSYWLIPKANPLVESSSIGLDIRRTGDA